MVQVVIIWISCCHYARSLSSYAFVIDASSHMLSTLCLSWIIALSSVHKTTSFVSDLTSQSACFQRTVKSSISLRLAPVRPSHLDSTVHRRFPNLCYRLLLPNLAKNGLYVYVASQTYCVQSLLVSSQTLHASCCWGTARVVWGERGGCKQGGWVWGTGLG